MDESTTTTSSPTAVASRDDDKDKDSEIPSVDAITAQTPPLQCCCGRNDCAFLEHSNSILESVEKDVHTAAKLGQTLLARHEAFMADAERDRVELTDRIGRLEMDKKDLEAENARKIEENRNLLDQLELLNTTVSDSETRILSLEASLQSSQQAVRRLDGAFARAEEMERHIAQLEAEQDNLQSSLSSSQTDARTAIQRWNKAERGISALQDQLEKMEKETAEEQERHAEVIGRLERQRALEKDLNTAAGRLKGAAAAKGLNENKAGATVVSHFVRDLLQDNATLQLGIAELREMLMNSNDEIQMLRDQLEFHQPIEEGDVSATSTLRAELDVVGEPPSPLIQPVTSPTISQELHIHHHYHVTKPEPKRPKKKRPGLVAGVFHPPIHSQDLSPAGPWQLNSSTPAPALISHGQRDSVSTASGPSHRWSVFSDQPSEFAASTVPSSPMSNPRLSMFDRGIMEISLPTSPTTSMDPTSPLWRPTHARQSSDISTRKSHLPLAPPSPSVAVASVEHVAGEIHRSPTPSHTSLTPQHDASPLETISNAPSLDHEITSAESECSSPNTDNVTPTYASFTTAVRDQTPDVSDTPEFAELPTISKVPRLHRTVSHESIMSVGGQDLHTLRARPSQLALRPLGVATAGTGLSAITAMPTLSRTSGAGVMGSTALRNNAPMGLPLPRVRIVSSPNPPQRSPSAQPSITGRLGRLASWRLPWGSTSPVNEPAISRTPSPTPAPPQASPTTPTQPTPARPRAIKVIQEVDLSRASGINQPGSIPGFHEYLAHHQRRGVPHQVRPGNVDTDALRDGLGDL